MTIPLQRNVIYGPVASRRLGRSLGINCSLPNFKVCSLDCLYCQYGYTRIQVPDLNDPKNYYPVGEILAQLGAALRDKGSRIDAITLSGNGESTAHPQFPEIVEGLINLRNLYAPGVRTAILSNATMLDRAEVRSAVSQLDDRIMKLDCGTEECFKEFNRPLIPTRLNTIVDQLMNLKDIIIQSLFTGGSAGNTTRNDIDAWVDQIRRIRPKYVQIYSLARPFPSRKIESLENQTLLKIAERVQNLGIKTIVY